MGNRSERRSDRLFSNSTKLSFVIAFALIWLFFSTVFESSSPAPANSAASSTESGQEGQDVASMPQSTASQPALTEPVKKEIENLFGEIEMNPKNKDRTLRQLRRILHQTFAGQEDCWSCEGVVYFDKFDQIAGRGEARKPFGFREWLDEGDEAYQNQKLDEARKYYSLALQVMDERSLQDDDTVDNGALERLRNRCQELRCR